MKPSRRQFLAHSSVLPFLGLLAPEYESPEDFYEKMEATIFQYKDRKQEYMDLVCDQMLPKIAEEGLADYVDLFCEEGYFDLADRERRHPTSEDPPFV